MRKTKSGSRQIKVDRDGSLSRKVVREQKEISTGAYAVSSKARI